MPFEKGAAAPKKIAVIGAGISGLAAAHLLAERHRVVLIEGAARLGGHARTLIAGKRGDQPVDTGFIVFNHANYPHLTRLFERLDVPTVKSSMSFGASFDGGRFEYSLRSFPAIFAQKRNAVDPRFLRMLADVMKFNAQGVAAARDPSMTIGGLIETLRLGSWFRDRYLLPLSGAIWSTPTEQILDFPAHAMMRFLQNHALLSATGQHQWYTVKGGSVEYVRRLGAALTGAGVDIRLSSPVAAVRRTVAGAEVRVEGAEWEAFDDVVLATHSDDSLAMLSDASPQERATLGAVRYQPNEVVLHADTAIMPKRRSVWSSWIYSEDSAQRSSRIDLTYWMNSLQPIPMDDPLFVTLNTKRTIREDLIHDVETFRHPVYDLAAIAAQGQVRAMNGTRATWFCGAWMRDGFHEDGFASAVEVAEGLLARDAALVAA